jgi:MFS family permease
MYSGGLLGPFGTLIVNPMLPELSESFGVSTAQAGWSLTAYLLVFAACLLFSGTLGEGWGRRRTVRTTFLVYAAASLLAAVAPSFELFLLARAGQGAANAFTTPLILAALADTTPPERMGRMVGTYAGFQTAGAALAPLVGGLVAEADWRIGFVVIAAMAALLSLWPPPGGPRPVTDRPRLRLLLTRRVATIGVAAATVTIGATGSAPLVSLYVREDLGRASSVAGIVLLAAAIGGMLVAPACGALVDNSDPRLTGSVGMVGASLLLLPFVDVDSLPALCALHAAAGMLFVLVLVSIQSLAATAVPANRGGALSVLFAFRFTGLALAPLIWLPIFESSPRAAFYGCAAVAVTSVAAFAAVPDPVR